MIYNLGDLVESFGHNAVHHARKLLEDNAVHPTPVGPDPRQLFGIVRPSRGRPLQVVARIHDPARGSVRLSGACSCRIARNCEHIAAVLLSALGDEALKSDAWERLDSLEQHDRRGAPTPRATVQTRRPVPIRRVSTEASESTHEHDAVTNWLDRVIDVVRSDAKPTPDGPKRPKHRLVYLLDSEPRTGSLTVYPRLVYIRKDGSYGAAKNCSYTGGRNRPAYVGVDDRELLPAILAYGSSYLGGSSFYTPVRIEAEGAAALVERLLATGRCHWQDPKGAALQPGDSKPATIVWSLDSAGFQRPRIGVEGCPDAVGLALQPPWYVDALAGLAGPLDLDVDPRAAMALLQAPGLSPESVDRVREVLKSATGKSRSALPVPRPIVVEERNSIPVPYLRLHVHRMRRSSDPWAPSQYAEIPLAQLTFDYDGERIVAEDDREILQRVVDGKLVRIARNVALEEDAVEHLEDLGFIDAFDQGIADLEQPGEFLPDPGDGDIHGFLLAFARHELPKLRKAGWIVEFDDDYPLCVIDGEAQWYADVAEGTNPWFDLELGVEIDGERHSLLPILVKLLSDPAFDPDKWQTGGAEDAQSLALRVPDGRILMLPAKRVQAILATLTELFAERPLDDDGALPLSTLHAPRLAELDQALGDGTLTWSGGKRARDLGHKLRNFRGLEQVAPPEGFGGTLRAYQRDGLNWLQFLREHELGGVLADDMGLGKTVQILAHLLKEKRDGRADRPSLVVAPTSVIENWRRESARFAPDLKVLVLHGQGRKAHFDRLAQHDLILTTYPLLSRDAKPLTARSYHVLILDEAQFIKNAKTKASLVAQRIDARHRLCLTGTPMENHLGELWSLFHVLMPSLLGDARQFRQLFRTPIEKYGDRLRSEQLAARVRPFLLRRTKDEVAAELPQKTEITSPIELGPRQRDVYESIRLAMNERVREEVAKKGLARSTIIILDALLKLRQTCCDPRLLKIRKAQQVDESAKLVALMEMLDGMLSEGRRILLFSQFTSMIKLIEQELQQRKLDWVKITGNTRDRTTPVRRFQAGDVPLFLISLRAGGTGLNLTKADTVIHYDPWWNPAVEDQATDRAHRIGQDKPVFVYRLIVSGSVEETMLALQKRKRELAEGIYGARGLKGGAPLSAEDLQVLFQPLPPLGRRVPR